MDQRIPARGFREIDPVPQTGGQTPERKALRDTDTGSHGYDPGHYIWNIPGRLYGRTKTCPLGTDPEYPQYTRDLFSGILSQHSADLDFRLITALVQSGKICLIFQRSRQIF